MGPVSINVQVNASPLAGKTDFECSAESVSISGLVFVLKTRKQCYMPEVIAMTSFVPGQQSFVSTLPDLAAVRGQGLMRFLCIIYARLGRPEWRCLLLSSLALDKAFSLSVSRCRASRIASVHYGVHSS